MGIIAKPERHLCVVQEVDQGFTEEELYRVTET
ncbi:uncharacterized protein METZ01_LOCUS499811, partial [marine metagenome]